MNKSQLAKSNSAVLQPIQDLCSHRRRRRRKQDLIHETSDLFGTGDKSTSFVGTGDELVNAGVILVDIIPLSKASSQVHHGIHGDPSLNCFVAAMESAQYSVSNCFVCI